MFLCGDVMTGRGVDQILSHPGAPELHEPHVSDARDYVRMAERVSGPIPQPAGPGWPWGEALTVLEDFAPAVRVINLETAITATSGFAPGKAIHYRMNPANIACPATISPDACALANNHVLDFGQPGLADTLAALTRAGLRPAGAGRDPASAQAPAVISGPGGRVLLYSCGTPSSGIPPGWAVTATQPGVNLVPDEPESADRLIGRIQRAKRPGDLVVVSIHWGSNWGYDVPAEHVQLAHRLIDGGADLIHGHSSHHPRPIELYRGKLILYGCGDCIDDYEGIPSHQQYRPGLRLLYFADLDTGSGTLAELRMVPMTARKMRLEHASASNTGWLTAVLRQTSSRFGTPVESAADGTLTVRGQGQ
jgi:poly-gamma-glutamate capsule biosynthesis protein CapA/YwtB (metallophosphatase superfamily)